MPPWVLKAQKARSFAARATFELAAGYNAANAMVLLLHTKDLPENNIRKVKIDSEDVGYLFSANCLDSAESILAKPNDLSEVKHLAFRKAATTTLEILESNIKGDSGASLADVLGEDRAALLLSTDPRRVPPSVIAEPELILPSLLANGYCHNEPKRIIRLPLLRIRTTAEAEAGGTAISLRPTRANISGRAFVLEIFQSVLPEQSDPINVFFFCYQVVEALLDELRNKNVTVVLSKIPTVAQDPIQSRKLVDAFSESISEKKLLMQFLSSKLPGVDLRPLLDECKEVLRQLGREDAETPLYDVRNYYFHALRLVRGAVSVDSQWRVAERFIAATSEMLAAEEVA